MYQSTSGSADKLVDTLAMGVETAATARDILQDRYLKETVCLVNEFNMANKGVRAVRTGNPCPKTSPGSSKAGLKQVVLPLRTAIYARRNKWAVPVALGVVLGVPFLLGYSAGKKSKR